MSVNIIDLFTMGFFTLYLGFFAGYAVGRRQGLREGIANGLRAAPLEMRRLTWLKGACVVCNAPSAIISSQSEAENLGESD